MQIETLDRLAAAGQIPNGCSVIKIDTDGYDLKVLQGGTAFLRRERPIILGEFAAQCLSWHGQSLDDVRQFATEHGYTVYLRDEDGRRFVREYKKPFTQDLLLVPTESVSMLGWCLFEH